ncbi:MAG: lipopolysaccharide biosynthesis protein [Nonlabens sp.]|uniref:lipopolysaccharide biosynthesis protein n=1 Tax=Nonlabens sp. TaxID=1888209 RepID=UPI00321AD746
MSNPVRENLRLRAALNSATGLIDYSAKMGVGFFLNPLMVTLLGPIFYGAWQVISQLNSYMATADIRAATSLKFILSKNRSVNSDNELKEEVSAALYSNLVFTPVYIILGLFVVWFAPILSGVEPQYFNTVRVASALLVFSFIITQFFFLFESTLHGMNLSYKRIGIRAFITIIGGVSSALVLYADYGIEGLAVVQICIATLIGFSFWWIVKKTIPWFEFVRVTRLKVISFIKLSSWYMLMKLSDLLSQSVDMILLGYLAGPKYVSVYAITKYLMVAASGLVRTISGSSSVGIAKFIGEKSYKKLLEARYQLVLIQWILIIISGSLVCIFNKSFISIWTDKDFFSGQIETYLIVIIALFTMLYQVDSSIINSTLRIKNKILVTLSSAIISIVLSFLLVPDYKTIGLLIAILAGMFFLSISLSFLVMKETQSDYKIFNIFFSRTSIFGVTIISIANWCSKYVDVNNWIEFIIYVIFTSLILLVITWYLALSKRQRNILQKTIKLIKNK